MRDQLKYDLKRMKSLIIKQLIEEIKVENPCLSEATAHMKANCKFDKMIRSLD